MNRRGLLCLGYACASIGLVSAQGNVTGTFEGLEYTVSESKGKWHTDADNNKIPDAQDLTELVYRKGRRTPAGASNLAIPLSNGASCVASISSSNGASVLALEITKPRDRFRLLVRDEGLDGIVSDEVEKDYLHLIKGGRHFTYSGADKSFGRYSPKGVWGAVVSDALRRARQRFASAPKISGTFDGLPYEVEVKEGVWFSDSDNDGWNDPAKLVHLLREHGREGSFGSASMKSLSLTLSNGARCTAAVYESHGRQTLSLSYRNGQRRIQLLDANYDGLVQERMAGSLHYTGERVDEAGLKARWAAMVSDALKQVRKEVSKKKK